MAQTLAGTAPLRGAARRCWSGWSAARIALAQLVQRFEAAVESGLTEWADVTDVAREVATAYDHVRDRRARAPAMACLNRVAARRVLEELVENALAFSPEGEEVLISIRVRPEATEVRVIDRGPGIDPAVAQRIFEPLEQAEALNPRTHQGMGLGLTIARMSARAMDGRRHPRATRARAAPPSCGAWRRRADRPGALREAAHVDVQQQSRRR